MKVRGSMVATEKQPRCSRGNLRRLPETPMPRRSLIPRSKDDTPPLRLSGFNFNLDGEENDYVARSTCN